MADAPLGPRTPPHMDRALHSRWALALRFGRDAVVWFTGNVTVGTQQRISHPLDRQAPLVASAAMGPSRAFVRSTVVAGLAICSIAVGLTGPASPATAADGLSVRTAPDPRGPVVQRATWRAYLTAISDAAVALPSEVESDLLLPAPSDPRTRWRTIDGAEYLLVTSLRYAPVTTVEPGAQFTLDSSRWVAIPGQLAEECVRYSCVNLGAQRLDMQLKQLMGLPPDADYRYVSEFWVKPSDMFRPCTDPRIASQSCPELTVGASGGVPATVGEVNLSDFLWSQANYAWRAPDQFRPKQARSCAQDFANASVGQCYGFPWTRLGYTYDWTPGAKDDVGVTEFVVAKGATAYLERVGSQREIFPYAKGRA
ncbi:unannotated protein [freshwater metagenome]|uniref:Unannotated protein n=1 Tax=freshwater metagenome TaxID=449393 RepID=A0A6J7D7M7_9ZZZZ